MKKYFVWACISMLIIGAPMQAVALSDIRHHWAKESIQKVIGLGLMKGYSNNTFGVKKEVTREELAAVITRLVDGNALKSAEVPSDAAGRWSETAITQAVALDLVSPLPDKRFAPTQAVTRGEVAKAIANLPALKELKASDTKTYSDIADSAYATQIRKVVNLGLMSGYPDGSFAPQKSITRAEFAAILVRVHNMIGGQTVTPETAPLTSGHTAKTQTHKASEAAVVAVETLSDIVEVKGEYHREWAKQVLDYVNAERAKAGLTALTWSEALESGTDIRAAEIVKLWSHDRPNGQKFSTVGTNARCENIAMFEITGDNSYPSSPEKVVNAWMNSAGHRKNILTAEWTGMSVSLFIIKKSNYVGMYWVQHFE